MSGKDGQAKVGDIVRSVLGNADKEVEAVLQKAVQRKYDKEKTIKRLGKVLSDDELVKKLVSSMFDISPSSSQRRAKRSRFSDADNAIAEQPAAKVKAENGASPSPFVNPHEVMLRAQQMIEERKRALKLQSSKIAPEQAKEFMNQALSARVSDLQESIRSKLSSINYLPSDSLMGSEPKPLILGAHGRPVDIAGQEVRLPPKVTPTLKANIRAEQNESNQWSLKATKAKEEEKKKKRKEEALDSAAGSLTHDERLSVKSAVRNRRPLKFVVPGEYVAMANCLRAKSKLSRLEQEISQAAKKTGISSAVKFAMVAPKMDTTVPSIEWWDSVVLPGESYDIDMNYENFPMVSSLIEHPIQLKPPGEHSDRRCLKVYLTKKEQRKLRRQTRKEILREKSEKIRLGLEVPPEPKIKISNLMRVLSSQAVQDPTKMEAHVRRQMASRLEKHLEENRRRKLTPAQRIAKRARKFLEEQPVGMHVAVFRILDLTDPAKRFKVEMNAKQLNIHGICVLHKDNNVVVVEGGSKQVRFYKNLMLNRIKWNSADSSHRKKAESETPNKCYLIWEGIVKKRSFGEFKMKPCPMEKMAQELFTKHGVEQYWDMAYSYSLMGDCQPEI